eukprot:jgi/Botrbrau1/12946/Bobra.154_2s0007.1
MGLPRLKTLDPRQIWIRNENGGGTLKMPPIFLLLMNGSNSPPGRRWSKGQKQNRLAKWLEYNKIGDRTKKNLQRSLAQAARRKRGCLYTPDAGSKGRAGPMTRAYLGRCTRCWRTQRQHAIARQPGFNQEWTNSVFLKLQGRLQAAVDATSSKALSDRLHCQHMDFIKTVNRKKQGVFRDIIIESDYDPLQARKAVIRVPCKDLRDPLKRDIEKGRA